MWDVRVADSFYKIAFMCKDAFVHHLVVPCQHFQRCGLVLVHESAVSLDVSENDGESAVIWFGSHM